MSLKSFFTSSFSNTDLGLLILRIGFGASMMILHGWGKITGGPESWTRIGGNMARFGLDFAPAFWGFMAAFAEFGCSALIILGVLVRPASLLLVITMAVAASRHLSLPADAPGSGIAGAAHALEFLVAWLTILVAGPGRYRFGASGK